MKKLIALFAVVAFAGVTLIAVASAFEQATGRATQHPENQSGSSGEMVFLDNGYGIVVASGRATGLDLDVPGPNGEFYFSLFYNVGSRPGGPNVCEPTEFPPVIPFVGEWKVDEDGNGTLFSYVGGVSLHDQGTVSIRYGTPGPGNSMVVACGKIAINP